MVELTNSDGSRLKLVDFLNLSNGPFSRGVHERRTREWKRVLQLRHGQVPKRGGSRNQRVLQGRERRYLSHILRLRTRHRNDYEHLQLSRPRAQRPRRTRFVFYHVVASPSRSLRGWLLSRSG